MSRFWSCFLDTRFGRVFLLGILLASLLMALLAGMDVIQLGTFEGWLTMITGISGIGYAFYHLFFCQNKENTQKHTTQQQVLSKEQRVSSRSGFLQRLCYLSSEFTAGVFPVLLLVLLLRSFLFEPFRIPSGSMLPTLHLGDFIVVNKYAYGVKLPVWGNTIIPVGEPKRGDVVVFRFPGDQSVDYIKRVVGIPGDVVAIKGNQVRINDHILPLQETGIYQGKQWQYVGGLSESYVEKNMNNLGERSYDVLWAINHIDGFEDVYRVPKGHYFVLGDNRSNSNDSRYWGWVPTENIKGRASYIWLNWYDEFDTSRIGLPL